MWLECDQHLHTEERECMSSRVSGGGGAGEGSLRLVYNTKVGVANNPTVRE